MPRKKSKRSSSSGDLISSQDSHVSTPHDTDQIIDDEKRTNFDDFENDPLKYVVRGLGAVLLAGLFVVLIYYDFILLQPYVNPVGYAFLIAVTLDKWRHLFYDYISRADNQAKTILPSSLLHRKKNGAKVAFDETKRSRIKRYAVKCAQIIRPPYWHRIFLVPSMIYYAVLAFEDLFGLTIFFDWLGETWTNCQRHRKWLEWSFFALIIVWVWNHFDRPSPAFILIIIVPVAVLLITWLSWTNKQDLVSTALVGTLLTVAVVSGLVVVHGVVIEVADIADTSMTWLSSSDFKSIMGDDVYTMLTSYLERSKTIVDGFRDRFKDVEGTESLPFESLVGLWNANTTSTSVVTSENESSVFDGILGRFTQSNLSAILDRVRSAINDTIGYDFDLSEMGIPEYLSNSDLWQKVGTTAMTFFNVISVSAAQVTITLASIIVYFSNQIFTTLLSMIMFLIVLYYLLHAQRSPIQFLSTVLPMSEQDTAAWEESATRAIRASLTCQIRIFVIHVMITLVSLRLAGSSFTYLPAIASGCLAVLPFIPSPLVVLPHNLVWIIEWFIVGQDSLGLLVKMSVLWVPQLFMYLYADTKVLESIDKAHMIPSYVAGLSIVSGIYVFGGVHGAIMGPMLLAMTTSAYEMFTRKLIRSPTRWHEDDEPVSSDEDEDLVHARSRSFTQVALQSMGAFAMELGRTLSTPRPVRYPSSAPGPSSHTNDDKPPATPLLSQ